MATGQGLIADGASDVSSTEGGPFNVEWDSPNIHCGYHKSGRALRPHLRFTNPGVQVGSTAITATLTGQVTTQDALTGGPIVVDIENLNNDGRWDANVLGATWTPSSSDDDWHAQLLAGTTVLVTTGAAASATQGGPDLGGDGAAQLQRLAQGTTITTGGTVTIARVSLGNAIFPGSVDDVWVELWSDVAGLPGVKLATSDVRPTSDIAAKIWAELRPTYDFTFTGAQQITVAVNDKIHVVLRSDAIPPTIHPGTWRYNYSGGNLSPYGTSPNGGFDIQNYLTVDDWEAIPVSGTPISWSFTKANGSKVSPNIGALITSRIAQPGYNPSAFFGFQLDPTAGSGAVIFAAYPAVLKFVLDITWTPPSPLPRRRVRISA